jgi:hypothetical protein
MPGQDPSNSLQANPAALRLLYVLMLKAFPLDEVKDFWLRQSKQIKPVKAKSCCIFRFLGPGGNQWSQQEWNNVTKKISRTEVSATHEKLVESICPTVKVKFDCSHAAIFINGQYLTKNVQALILRKIIKSYAETGRQEFERREFLYDPEIVKDPKNPHFDLRFKRLSKRLAENWPQLQIPRSGYGQIHFVPACEVEYCEV